MRRGKKDLLTAGIVTWLLPGVILALLHLGKAKPLSQSQPTETLPPPLQATIHVLTDEGMKKMEMNDYLLGVLLCEMPESFSIEAKKAQAVVARTYALRTAQQKDKHPQNAVCGDPSCCQGYLSPVQYKGSEEGIEQARQAVLQTQDQVLLYRGDLIDATYFSCSGGKTEAAVAVWGTDVPYLQSVASPGEEIASHYTDTVRFSREDFENALSVQLTGEPASWIGSAMYTQGGGIANVTVCGKEFTGTQLRSLLNLRSTYITMHADAEGITVSTKGFGHRVGMSQYGAQAMALAGHDYREILLHYYAGVYIGKQ